MIRITHPILGKVEFAREEDAYWETRIEFSGRAIEVDINIDGTTDDPHVLDSVTQFVGDPAKFDRLARAAMQHDEVVRDYMDHHLERSTYQDIDAWLRLTRCFGEDNARAAELDKLTVDLDRFLSKLYLRRIGLYPQQPEECVVFNYTIGDDITNYLIVARFDSLCELTEISMES
jgi:hypothetical protein